MSGSKAENYDVPAQEWFNGLVPSPDMVQNIQRIFALHQPKRSIDIKVERHLHDMQISGKIMEVRSTEQFAWYPKKLLHFFLQVL